MIRSRGKSIRSRPKLMRSRGNSIRSRPKSMRSRAESITSGLRSIQGPRRLRLAGLMRGEDSGQGPAAQKIPRIEARLPRNQPLGIAPRPAQARLPAHRARALGQRDARGLHETRAVKAQSAERNDGVWLCFFWKTHKSSCTAGLHFDPSPKACPVRVRLPTVRAASMTRMRAGQLFA